MGTIGFSHLGLCCSDLARSTAFYCDVLGFRELFTMEMGDELRATMEVDDHPRPMALRSRMLARDDVRLELLAWSEPDATGTGERRPMTAIGLTHLCIRVEDAETLDEVAARAVAAGGRALEDTRTTLGGMGIDGGDVTVLHLTDPDGVRVELMAGAPDLSQL